MDGGDYLRTMRTMLNEYPSTYAHGPGAPPSGGRLLLCGVVS